MRLIKVGTQQLKTEGKSVDDVVKMLMEQKKNGETYIETVEKQCANLA
jgi:predicted CopG family antitoxin